MKILIIILPFLAAVLLSRMIIPYITFIAYRKRLFDPVDKRKMHTHPTPRLGGVAFVPIQCCLLVITLVAIIKGIPVDLQVQTWAILPTLMMLICGLFILYLMGIGDDLIGVSYRWKFVVQIFAALLLPLSGLWINDFYGVLGIDGMELWWGWIFTVFMIVLTINSINLMDGIDGLSSGIIGIGCLFLGVLFLFRSAWLHALFAFITIGVLIPFFYYNVFTKRPLQKIFMGDTGSMTLGFSMAFLAISYSTNNTLIKPFDEGALIVAFSALIIPVLDVGRVMYVRWRNGKPVFQPDQSHLHHKLLNKGFDKRQTLFIILGLTVFYCVFNYVAVHFMNNNVVILLDLLLWGIFQFAINKYPSRTPQKKKVLN